MKMDYLISGFISLASWLVVSSILISKGMLLLMTLYSAFFLLFPFAYAFAKFYFSDCLNKDAIMREGMSEYSIMVFKDGRQVLLTRFIENEMVNANFWIVVVSVALFYMGVVL